MAKNKFTRRDFIKATSLVSIPFSMGGVPLYFSNRPQGLDIQNDNDRILVLVQLQGGNDGLATIFHGDHYDALQQVRSNIIIPDGQLIDFHDDYSFHPNMQGFKDVWEMGSLGIVQNVGYPNQNRSHFRSTDIWNSGSSAEDFVTTGWIGRLFDQDYATYPNGFPNADNPHPFALTMGKIVSETCQGVNSNYSLSLLDPFNPGTAFASGEGDIPDNCFGDALSFVNDTVAQTNAYASAIQEAAEKGNNLSAKWEGLEHEFATKLKHVARLISGGLQTKVYIVQLGGFDTHDNQVVDGDTTTGRHGELLTQLSESICAFQDDLVAMNLDSRVLGMTYSEFGRRIRSNGSLGTDHGTAAPLFVFGSCAENTILGDHPEIDTAVGIEDGVPMEYDFRDIYATVLHDWLGVLPRNIEDVLHDNVLYLPLIKEDCKPIVTSQNDILDSTINVFPNPFTDYIEIMNPIKEEMDLLVLDGKGSVINRYRYGLDRKSNRIDLKSLPPGSYFLHFRSKSNTGTKKIIKL